LPLDTSSPGQKLRRCSKRFRWVHLIAASTCCNARATGVKKGAPIFDSRHYAPANKQALCMLPLLEIASHAYDLRADHAMPACQGLTRPSSEPLPPHAEEGLFVRHCRRRMIAKDAVPFARLYPSPHVRLPPIQRSILASSTSSGTEPSLSTSAWNSRMSKFLPSACSARARSCLILSSPIL